MSERNQIQMAFPVDNRQVEKNMEKCAAFMARMIMKYGKEVLGEIERDSDCGEVDDVAGEGHKSRNDGNVQ